MGIAMPWIGICQTCNYLIIAETFDELKAKTDRHYERHRDASVEWFMITWADYHMLKALSETKTFWWWWRNRKKSPIFGGIGVRRSGGG